MNDRVKELLERNRQSLAGMFDSSRKSSQALNPPVGQFRARAPLDLEFFGTHYRTTNPARYIANRPGNVRAVVHLFEAPQAEAKVILYGCQPDEVEFILHNHPYNDGCFTNYKCRMLEKEEVILEGRNEDTGLAVYRAQKSKASTIQGEGDLSLY